MDGKVMSRQRILTVISLIAGVIFFSLFFARHFIPEPLRSKAFPCALLVCLGAMSATLAINKAYLGVFWPGQNLEDVKGFEKGQFADTGKGRKTAITIFLLTGLLALFLIVTAIAE